ncbi:ABC transporter permease [Variovorax sp. PBL-E5]|uniref:ABC transporter permease n=1 Tax=Variovorax sp. PBL-E5 TaxID=434014 RepID=UPI001316BB7A|nr:ABC transporter permease [Variovorax sp. PBL-E5]VTU25270.1 Putative aliphatic sulfonates transport permease protein SsuC [Variovorax sp. PBL-E5]
MDETEPIDMTMANAKAAAGGAASDKARGLPEWLAILLLQFGVVLAALALWQMAASFGWGVKVVVQSPASVAKAFMALVAGEQLWPNYWATLKATMAGLVIAVLIGTPIGLALGLMPMAQRVVAPFLSAINAMPRIALAPVFIVVFGITMSAKVALAVSLVVFIMILNAIAGVAAADPESVRMMTALGASRAQTLRMVVLPAALPSILTGVRLGLIYSLLGVIASELIASADGLGQMIARSAGVFDLATVYAALLLLMVTAAIFNTASEALGRWLLRWQAPTAH